MLYDKDIREPLFDYLEERYGKARMIEEKQMGRSRADIVMVLPGELAGIEIKSDADTYARLKRQVKDYDRFFDRNYVVAGSTHAMHIGEHVPEYWGIISVEQMEEGVDFYMIREAARNPKMELELKLRILWRPELAHIQAICGMAKYGGKSKEFVRNKIAEGVPAEILNELISEELFERDYTEIRREIEAFRGEEEKMNKCTLLAHE
ncbi:hypothetical protein IMSAGC007_04028 [Lachnospiraceae bacterium]|nr:hypothetical protein IMSAGC007_04028 [Lachnospiraceae bacterium]